MTYELIVVQPFGAYPVGALVTDAAQVAEILDSEQATRVVRVALAAQPSQQAGSQHTGQQQAGSTH